MKTNPPKSSSFARFATCLALTAFATSSFAQTNYERIKIAPPLSADNAYFSWDVAISGNRVLSSAPGPLDSSTGFPWLGGGLRKVFVHDAVTGQLLLQLEASDGAADDGFGWSIAAAGNSAVIGAPFDHDLGYQSGSVYHFDLQTGQELGKFHAVGGNVWDWYGATVATDGSLAIIGATADSKGGVNSGAAYIVDLSTGQQLFRLESPDPERGAGFGTVVAIANGFAVVTRSPSWPPSNPPLENVVYVFDATTGQLLHQLNPVHGGPEYGFGSVAISGTRILVGEVLRWGPVTPTTPNGSVHVYDGATGQWLYDLVGPPVDEPDGFGGPLAADGDLVVVGALKTRFSFKMDGAAYVFDAVSGTLRTRLTLSTPTTDPEWIWGEPEPWGARLGARLAYDGGLIAASSREEGTPGPSGTSTGNGNTYVFDDTVVSSGRASCPGDGTGSSCPCGASGFLGEGCRSSTGRGAHLYGAGNADVAGDELRLLGCRLPEETPLFLLQGTLQPAQAFGEGLLCSNVTYRHGVQFASTTGSTVFEDLGLHATPGSTLLYQCWYRDSQSSCGLGGSNLTNGWAVTW